MMMTGTLIVSLFGGGFLFLIILLLPLLFYALLLMWLIPLGYTVQSLVNLLTMPRDFFRIATNKGQRRNHALEHGTVNVIEEQYGTTHLAGYATEDGFVIRGFADPEMIYTAANKALIRMQSGERELAIHKRCGTSIAAGNLLASILFIVILVAFGQANIWTMILAMMAGSFLGPIVGPLTQKYLTTATDLEDVEIMGYAPQVGQVVIYTRQSELDYKVV